MICCCWLLPLAAVGLVTVVSHGISTLWRLRGTNDGEPHCAQCRYLLRGVGSWQCPECGADLHNNGVLSRELAEPFPVAARMILWTFALPGPVLLLGFILSGLMPFNYVEVVHFTGMVQQQYEPTGIMFVVAAACGVAIWLYGMKQIDRTFKKDRANYQERVTAVQQTVAEEIEQSRSKIQAASQCSSPGSSDEPSG